MKHEFYCWWWKLLCLAGAHTIMWAHIESCITANDQIHKQLVIYMYWLHYTTYGKKTENKMSELLTWRWDHFQFQTTTWNATQVISNSTINRAQSQSQTPNVYHKLHMTNSCTQHKMFPCHFTEHPPFVVTASFQLEIRMHISSILIWGIETSQQVSKCLQQNTLDVSQFMVA